MSPLGLLTPLWRGQDDESVPTSDCREQVAADFCLSASGPIRVARWAEQSNTDGPLRGVVTEPVPDPIETAGVEGFGPAAGRVAVRFFDAADTCSDAEGASPRVASVGQEHRTRCAQRRQHAPFDLKLVDQAPLPTKRLEKSPFGLQRQITGSELAGQIEPAAV